MKKSKPSRATFERALYIALIVLLLLFGLWDSEAAARLIKALSDAFSILIHNP